MSRPALNGLIVVVACLAYVVLGLMSGRTSLNGGLGQDGPIYAAMVTNHDLRGASAINKLTPAFPLAAAVVYVATGNVVCSFVVVNIIAFALMVFLPALLVWLLVQYWARGGAAGLLDRLRFSRVRADAAFWSEALFILLGIYFLMTTLGGLTILLWSRPAWIKDAVSQKPELLALVLPVIPFIVSAGLDVPRTIPFLLPFWFFAIAAWARGSTGSLTVPLALATVLTLLTQHPWVRLNDTNYFVDWFPYSVHAARVSVTDPGFSATWRVRVFIAAGGLAAFVAWRRAWLEKRSS